MQYLLITGATGLVGRYLLRDLFREDCRLAVVVRPTRVQSAFQRVESIMRRWESDAGHALPRPVILPGDLNQPMLGLAAADLDWVARRCDSVLHSAASLSFTEEPKTGEPFRTNVEGTQHLLDLCERTGVRRFHHVSTAYVCGLRDDRVYERDVDVGQENCNPYEASKLTAEKRIRGAEFLDQVTVYRPSSVLGDSVTGYTSTTHGFYLPLQLAYNSVNRFPVDLIDDRFMKILGLDGHERQNLVPVDWVSASIAHIALRQELHGSTYHLTHPRAVSVRLMREVIQEAIGEFTDPDAEESADASALFELMQRFSSQMDTYKSYFRDDPEFDRTNTEAAVGHIPLPEIDRDLLLRMSRYPLRHKFAPRRDFVQDEESVAKELASVAACGEPLHSVRPIGLQINGRGGGQWTLMVAADGRPQLKHGLPAETSDLVYLNTHAFERLVGDSISLPDAIAQAQVSIEPTEAAQAETAETAFAKLLDAVRASRRQPNSVETSASPPAAPMSAAQRGAPAVSHPPPPPPTRRLPS